MRDNILDFLVTVPGGRSPPVVCGLNTGQHMFLDSSSLCNILSFNIGKLRFQGPSFNIGKLGFQGPKLPYRLRALNFNIGKLGFQGPKLQYR